MESPNQSTQTTQLARPKTLKINWTIDPSGWLSGLIVREKKMKLLKTFSYLLALALFHGCTDMNPSDFTRNYSWNGISFDYSAGWKVLDENDSHGIIRMNAESPRDAIVMIQLYPVGRWNGLDQMVEQFRSGTQGTLPNGFSYSDSNLSTPALKEGMKEAVETFLISDANGPVPHIRRFVAKEVGDHFLFIMAQVADEDIPKDGNAIDIIIRSATYDSNQSGDDNSE